MQKVKLGAEEIVLDDDNLVVSEEGLNEFLCKFSSIYNYYSGKWAEAQYYHHMLEDQSETLYARKFEFYKNEGSTDKLAEARAKSNDEVVAAKAAARKAKLMMQKLNGYLRSLDKSHEDALNLGYNIRKEIDKVFPKEIKGVPRNYDLELDRIMNEG